MVLDQDAFADGQIGSKIWLCETLESLLANTSQEPVIWIFGGWYGVLAFLLFARARIRISGIRSFDLDPKAEPIADILNNHWEIDRWRFKSHTHDVNKIDFLAYGPKPDIIINTSCEHFKSMEWWDRIPSEIRVVLQATDMMAGDHVNRVLSMEQMQNRFHLKTVQFRGEKKFHYPDFSFTRYMVIGYK